MSTIKSRKELFALLQAICEENREYYSRFGQWKRPQIKVFWLEVNVNYVKKILELSEAKCIDKCLYSLNHNGETYWIDTSNKRIWQIFCLSQTKTAFKMLKSVFLGKRGVDKLWAPESFMFKVQNEFRYTNRGFGIRFEDTFTMEEPKSIFSAKLWIGRNLSERQEQLLNAAKDNFSKSSIRFGKNWSTDGRNISGELYEFFYIGENYAYITPQPNACMNVAPRFGALSARHLSSDVKIYYEGCRYLTSPYENMGERRVELWRRSIFLFDKSQREVGPFFKAGYKDFFVNQKRLKN